MLTILLELVGIALVAAGVALTCGTAVTVIIAGALCLFFALAREGVKVQNKAPSA